MDLNTLQTLPKREIYTGLGEIIKYGIIYDKEFFKYLEDNPEPVLSLDNEAALHMTARSCEIKAEVVSQDEKELGLRAILNFGHTLGHALEKYYNFTGLTHGYAVAIGMSTFTHIAERIGMCKAGVAEKLDALLTKCGLPTTDPAPMDELFKISLGDKKHLADTMNIVICSDIGKSEVVKMSVDEYEKFLKS